LYSNLIIEDYKGVLTVPRVGKNIKTISKKTPEKMICQNPVCKKAGKEQPSSRFYNTNSSILPKYPLCKDCVQDIINIKDMQTVYKVLQDMNIAFIKSVWDIACEKTPENPFGSYIRQMNSLPQYKGFTWGCALPDKPINNSTYSNADIEFEITPQMIKRWGQNHSPEEYMKLEDFYNQMRDANKIETPQDEFYLKKLSVISLKLDEELEAGNYGQVKSLGDLFSKYMADSQFRAMDKTDADKIGGVRNFGAIYMEVEKDGFIPPWEYYRKIRGVNQDIVDKTIMHIENFILKLNKIETMIVPPNDTPKIDLEEIDDEIKEIERDDDF
jgi:hypothetical protein